MSLRPRHVTTTDRMPIQFGIGGTFSYIINRAFADELVRRLDAAPPNSIEINADVWMMAQCREEQLTFTEPIVFSDYENDGRDTTKIQSEIRISRAGRSDGNY